jgi:chorismate dehydratase
LSPLLEKRIRISIVNYFNTLPFRYGLKNSPIIHKIDLQEDIPSICAQKLKFGQVDIGLVPIALLPELDHYQIITDYCIGANGRVDSVKLYSDVPLHEITAITLDYQSRSSVALTKVLSKFFWKLNIPFTDGKPGFEKTIEGSNAGVVIGDRTFSLNGTFKFEYDLAEEWKKFTGLPFVFAAWVSTGVFDSEFEKELNSALKAGVQNIDQALLKETNRFPSGFDPRDYLTHKISYGLDVKKKQALELFLDYLNKL